MPHPSLIEQWSQSADQRIATYEAGQAAQEAADDRPWEKYLPKSILDRREAAARRAQAQAAGEDPRITAFLENERTASQPRPWEKYLKNMPGYELRRNRQADARRTAFLDANPDLDPRIADQKVKRDGKEESAEELLQNVIRLTVASQDGGGPKQYQQLKEAGELYRSIKDQLSPQIRAKYALDEVEATGVWDKHSSGIGNLASGDYWKQGAAEFVSTPVVKQLFNAASVPAKGTTTGIAQALRGNWSEAAQATRDIVPQDPRDIYKAFAEGTTSDIQKAQEGLDVDGDGNVNLRETLGFQPTGWKEGASKGERAAGNVAEFAWSLITDPTTYMALGTAGKAKAGLQALEKNGLTDVANTIRRSGWNALDDVQRQAAEQVIRDTVEEGVRAGARSRGQAAKTLAAMQKQGRSGVKFGGKTVIPYHPFSAGDNVASKVSEVASAVSHADLQPGHILTGFGNAEVVGTTPGGVIFKPNDSVVAVTKAGEKQVVRPSDLKEGMELLDGEAKVLKVNPDGSVEIELKSQLINSERPWTVEPLHKPIVGDQGTLIEPGVKDQATRELAEDRAITDLDTGRQAGAANVRLSDVDNPAFPRPPDPNAGQQGQMFDPTPFKGRLAPDADPIEDALAKVDAAPKATDAGGYGGIVDMQLPKKPGVVSMEDGMGGTIIGIRGADGTLQGYLMATDDAINTFEALVEGQGIGQKLLDAASEAGLDVPKLLANSDFTDAGRASARKWLRQKVASADGAVDDVEVPASRRSHLSLTADVISPSGGTSQRRIWRRTGKKGLAEGSQIPSVNGTVVGMTDDGVLRLKGDFQVGQELAPIQGKVIAVSDDGVADVVPLVDDRAKVALRGRAAFIQNMDDRAASLSPAEATEVPSAPTSAPEVPQAQGGAGIDPSVPDSAEPGGVTLKDMTELGEHGAYGPKPTDAIEKARMRAGRPGEAPDPDAQMTAFDRDYVSVHDLQPGVRIPTLQGEVLATSPKKGVVTMKLDDVVRTVYVGETVETKTLKELSDEDILPDAAVRIIKVNDDGTVQLKGLLGGRKSEIRTSIGGTPISPGAAARLGKVPGLAGAARAFSPRAAVRGAERLGLVPKGTAERLYQESTRAAAKLSHAEDEVSRLVTGGYKLIAKQVGREQAQKIINTALDVVRNGETVDFLARLKETAKVRARRIAAQGGPDKMDEVLASLKKGADVEKIEQGINAFLEAKKLISKAEEFTDGFKFAETLLKVGDEGLPLILTKTGRAVFENNDTVRRLFLGKKRIENLTRGFEFVRNGDSLLVKVNEQNLLPESVKRHLKDRGNGVITINGDQYVTLNLHRPVREVNEAINLMVGEQARKALGLPLDKPIKLFDEDALTVFAMRGRSAFAKAIEADMLTRLAAKSEWGEGAIRIIKDGDERAIQQAGADNFIEVRGFESPVGRVFAPPEIADELSNMRAVITNDETLKSFGKFMQQFSNVMARYMTSPITKGLAFPMRNSLGNSWNTSWSAINDGWVRELPNAIRTGNRLEKLSSKIGSVMKKEGLTFDEAAKKVIKTDRDRQLLDLAREHGIINSGFFRTIDWDSAARTTSRVTQSKKRKALNFLNPVDPDFIGTKPGMRVNERIEDMHRLIHFVGVLDATGSIDEAVASVQKYLFDYNDLTPFERLRMKNINRFYTFMRKNTALQMSLFANRPGLYAHVYNAKQSMFGDEAGLAGGLYPGEEKDGSRQAPGWMSSIFGNGVDPGVVNIETPTDAAIRTVDPFFQTAVYGAEKLGIDLPIPPSQQPTAKSIVGGFMETQTAGGPAALVDALFSLRTGVDTYTGRPLKESDTKRKLVDTFFPLYGHTEQAVKGYNEREYLLKLLTGITYHSRGEDKTESLQYAWSREVEEVLARLKDEGVEVPTIGDLQDAGLMPSQAELNAQFPKPRTIEMTPEEKREQARKKLFGE